MLKHLLTITLTTFIALHLTTAIAVYANFASPLADHSNQSQILIAAEETPTKNKLIIPKPSTLPGPGTSEQEAIGGVRSWFTDTVLSGWAKGMVGFVGMLSFLMLVISGVRYMTAYGNDEAATAAKKMVIYSLVGLLLSMFSYAIVYIIITFQFT